MRKGRTSRNRVLTWMLSLAMVLSMVPGIAVAAAGMPGARSEYNATTGDVFLGGNYIEVGISKHGSFGTSTLPTSNQNWHPHSSASGLGLTSDGDGWDVGDDPSTGDFFLPGTPEERWGFAYKIDGTTYQYFVADRNSTFTRGWTKEPTVADTSTPESGLLKAVVTGETTHGVEIKITYSFGVNDKFYTTSVEVNNKGGSTITDVRFIRSFDPDQDQQTQWTYNTYNKVICNPVSTSPGNTGNYAMVVARGQKTFAGFFFLAFDNRARASHGVAFDPNDIYVNGLWDSAPATALTCAENASVALTQEMVTNNNLNGYINEDNAIALTFNLGAMDRGAMDSLEFISSLDPNVEECLAAILNLTLDYKNEVLTGIEEAEATYTIRADDNAEDTWTLTVTQNHEGGNVYRYTLTKGENTVSTGFLSDGIKIPEEWYGKTLIFQQNAEGAEPVQIEVAGRPETPDGPSSLPDDVEKPENIPEVEIIAVTENSVTVKPIDGQEYFYSTDGGTTWAPVPADNKITVEGGSVTPVQIKTRIAATASAPASAYSEPVIVTLKQMIKDMEGFSASGYTGAYDGAAHSITVTAPEGAEVAYSKTPGTDYTGDTPTYTNAGEYTVYYRVTMDGCYPVYGSETVRISKADITVTADAKSKAYGDADPALTYTVNDNGLKGSDTLIGKLTRAAGTDAGTYAIQQGTLTSENNPNYAITFVPANLTITAKTVTPTIELTPGSFAFDGTAKEPTVTLRDGETVIPSTEYTVTYSNNINVGTEAVATITDKEGGNYTFTQATRNFTITPKGVTPAVAMEDYVYGTTPSTPTPTVSGNESGGTETVYYSTYSDIAANPTHRIVWADMTGTTLNVGTYYMAAHVAANGNYAEGTSAVITFKVKPSPYAAPTTPTVSGFTVTVNEADRAKKLEYAVVTQRSPTPTKFVSVPALKNGSFDLTGLAERTDYTVYLRQKASADGNYAASDPVSKAFRTSSEYSVAYNANYGTGTVPASVTSSGSVTVASGSGLRRTGYTFNDWNTQADGSGTPYAAGDPISNGATLYAQWMPKNYTVKFDANSGSGTMADQVFTYDAAAAALSANSFTKDGYHFAGWATSASGSVVYSDKQSVKNLASSGSVTLYAVWVQNRYGISGTITSDSNVSVTVKLMRGNTQIGDSQTVGMSGSNAPYTGTYGFSNIPAGTYNIVATQVVSGKIRTITALVVVTDGDQTENITVPGGDTSSVLDVKEDTRPVVVGGLDDEASTKAEAGKSITVTMTVEKKEEQQLPDTASQAEQQTQEAIAEIKAEAPGKALEFMVVEVKKDVTVGSSTTTEKLAVTNTVMEIVIPYDMAGKNNITVYRHHDGVTEAFTENTTKADGTFSLDRENNLIYVYAQKFSTYAIGYTVPSSGGSGSSGGSVSYPITLPDSNPVGGKISVSPKSASKGSTVTITVAPDDGYELDKLTVTDKNGNKIPVTAKGNGKYTFEMPSGKVTIEATFKAPAWNRGYGDCPKNDTCSIWPYTDAKTTDWYHDGVHFCLENSLMVGYGDKTFRPNNSTTRAMLIVMLWRLNGSPVVNYALDFEDVEEGAWYTEAVRWAKSEGVAGGYGNGKFGPNDTLTREQMVVMLYRYAQYKSYDVSVGEDTNILSFGDATTVVEYAIPAMQWACGSGVVDGKNAADGSGLILDPKGSTTRAQMATMMMRFCAEIVK